MLSDLMTLCGGAEMLFPVYVEIESIQIEILCVSWSPLVCVPKQPTKSLKHIMLIELPFLFAKYVPVNSFEQRNDRGSSIKA